MVRLADALDKDWPELAELLQTDKALRGRIFALLGSSLALGDHLVAHPQAWRLLHGKAELPSAEELKAAFTECATTTPAAEVQHALRRLYRDRLMVLAAVDVAPTVENERVLPFETIGAHLSDLADAAVAGALEVAYTTVCKDGAQRPRLAVIAMGKCGARELNYVSDVDVIFVGEDADSVITRVAGEMMRFASDTFFETDAALRPEGKRGQLVRTLDSHIAYYQRWAKTWEFQALLKARAAVGDPELGEQYIAALMPLVWTACDREDFVPDVQAMRRRVEELVPAGVKSRELKLGKGGLRDVEFAVQYLVLSQSAAHPELRGNLGNIALLQRARGFGRGDERGLELAQERGQVGTGLPAGTPARHVGPTPVHSLAKSRTWRTQASFALDFRPEENYYM